MISPVCICKNIWKVLPPPLPTISVCSNTGLQLFRNYSIMNRMAEPQWQTAKTKLLKLSLEERRKLYKSKDYVILDMVDPWCHYVLKNQNIESKKHTLDDVTEFKKIKVNAAMHEELSKRVSIFKGDITKLEVDAIVNAANSFLRAGGGVDGVIHRGAGHLLQEECNTLGGCPTGDAKITGAYTLPAKYVIHTVGPQDGSPSKLESCYQKCLSFQEEYDLRSIAFPCISTGIYGFPNRLAAHIALRTARKFLENNDRVERIIFCTFMPIDVDIYETLLQMYFPVHEWNYNDSSTGTE